MGLLEVLAQVKIFANRKCLEESELLNLESRSINSCSKDTQKAKILLQLVRGIKCDSVLNNLDWSHDCNQRVLPCRAHGLIWRSSTKWFDDVYQLFYLHKNCYNWKTE